MSAAGERHMAMVASLGCVICRRDTGEIVPCEVHHIAEGSSHRDDFLTAGLCVPHHRGGGIGLHGVGVKAFCRIFKLASEYALVSLVNKFRAEDRV